jgi:pimeloyl-ACP methyl ester carboxylesterase
MERLEFDDVEVSFQVHDAGERIVLVHASPFVSWYRPLVEQLDDYSTLVYRRHLRLPDSGNYRPLTVEEDAAICVRLMGHVGWPAAHLVGHSYGALVALQLAIDAPKRVSSVALLEPAARGISNSDAVAAALQPVIAAYRSGDLAGAVDRFLRHVCGDGYRDPLEQVIPDAFTEAVAEAGLFFEAEMPAVARFAFGPGDAERVTQPVLNVVGANSVSRFIEGAALVQSWFPHAERFTVPAAGHLLMVENPTAVADGLKHFLARQPISRAGARSTQAADHEHRAQPKLP